MTEATLSVPNAILFILDPTNSNANVPEYMPGEATSSNEGCVSVVVRAEVDGEVTVRLAGTLSDAQRAGCKRVFEGNVVTPGRRVAVVTSDFEELVETAVSGDSAMLKILVDDLESPGLLCVEARS